MRLSAAVNWTLLCLNTLLLVSLLFFVFLGAPVLPLLNPAVRRAQSDAAVLGMDVYSAKDPFAILVAKDFPRNGSFDLLQHGQPLSLSVEDDDGNERGARKRVTVGLSTEFSVSFDYSAVNGGKVEELRLSRNNEGRVESFFDFNADGSFDLRIVRDLDRGTSRHYVFYENDWREVKDFIGQYQKRLVGGQEVTFDMRTGKWLPSTNK